MTAERDQALRTLTEAWLGLRRGRAGGRRSSLSAAEVLLAGRPGLLDIVARGRGPAGPHGGGAAGSGRRAPLPPLRRGVGARPARRRGRARRLHRRAARRPAGRAAAGHGARRRGPSRTGGGPARRRRRHRARLRRPGRPPRLPVARRGRRGPTSISWWRWTNPASTTSPPRWCAGSGRERPRGGAGAAGRPLAGLGAGPDLAARLLRVRRLARGRRRRLRRRGPGARAP